jgi:hypothetical protein
LGWIKGAISWSSEGNGLSNLRHGDRDGVRGDLEVVALCGLGGSDRAGSGSITGEGGAAERTFACAVFHRVRNCAIAISSARGQGGAGLEVDRGRRCAERESGLRRSSDTELTVHECDGVIRMCECALTDDVRSNIVAAVTGDCAGQ